MTCSSLWQFVCAAQDLYSVRKGLIGYGYTVTNAEIDFLPIQPLTLDDAGYEALAITISKIEEIEDVFKVYPNVE